MAGRYPLLLDLAGRDALVVGGGPVAARRAAGLLEAGALVTVLAPAVCEDLHDLAAAGTVRWVAREVADGDVADGPAGLTGVGGGHGTPQPAGPAGLAGAGGTHGAGTPRPAGPRWWLVHTATGDRAADAAVAAEAERSGVWCVRADLASASAAHVPAVATGPDGVGVAVSGGGDPGRARAIRDAIADLLAAGRLPLRRTRPAPSPAPGIAFDPRDGSPDPVRSGNPQGCETERDRGTRSGGVVVLVGGGPGDPGLLTVSGRQWLARADVVVTDRLGPVGVLRELDPSVEVIDVGKTAGHHPIPQDAINRLLVEHALAGRTVVRLKGGDPFVLGRGGEEALHCIAHGVRVEVVPGVTSAVSVPAAAGIPVTHRGVATSFVLASAHAGAGNALEAARSAPPGATLVLLMGLSSLARTAAELVAGGHPASTPVAVISNGWTPEQRTVVGTLASIAEDVATAGLRTPAVTVVGAVVALRAILGDLAGPHPPAAELASAS